MTNIVGDLLSPLVLKPMKILRKSCGIANPALSAPVRICDRKVIYGWGFLLLFLVFSLAPSVQAEEVAPTQCPRFLEDVPAANAAARKLFNERVKNAQAVGVALTSMPAGFDTPEAHGAKGDGKADDTSALQTALNESKRLWLGSNRIYRITHRLELTSGTVLTSNGTATVLMAAGSDGFNNILGRRSDPGIYTTKGTGFRLIGSNILVSDIFIVKAYEDDRYVIAMDIREASHVKIERVQVRGFSLAPGIITIRSSDEVDILSSLIHGTCTQTSVLPADIPSYQITGISVDDSRIDQRDSSNIRLQNNVIYELTMIPSAGRGVQTDGINFSGVGAGAGSKLIGNDISGVDEGMDIFGTGILIQENRVAATSRTLKIIHGASNIEVTHNTFRPGPRAYAIGIFKANPPEARRQVRDIRILDNRIEMADGKHAGIHVDGEGQYLPMGIVLKRNTFVLSDCNQQTVACAGNQCAQDQNEHQQQSGKRCVN